MLKANVGLSRKWSKDFNSTGFSLNLEGEINAALDDPEAVIERIKELYSVAEEALDRQVSECQEIEAIARRDQDQSRSNGAGHPDPRPAPGPNVHAPGDGPEDLQPLKGEPATNKQVAFLLTLAKRARLQGPGLEARIEEVIGRRCSPYDLLKKEAGAVIEALNPEGPEKDRPRG